MVDLDQDLIKALLRAHKTVNTCRPLFVLEYEDEFAVTDGSALLSWPADLVDTECEGFKQLQFNSKEERAVATAQRIVERHWKKQLIFQDRYYPCEEVDAHAGERNHFTHQLNGLYTAVFETKNERINFHARYYEMAWDAIEDPRFKIYKPFKQQNSPYTMRLLSVFDRRELVGLIIHQPYRGMHVQEVEDRGRARE